MDEPVRYSPALQTAKGECRVRTKTQGYPSVRSRRYRPLYGSVSAIRQSPKVSK
jgi:hypothetical protein